MPPPLPTVVGHAVGMDRVVISAVIMPRSTAGEGAISSAAICPFVCLSVYLSVSCHSSKTAHLWLRLQYTKRRRHVADDVASRIHR